MVYFNGGPILHVMSKDSKESLKIETVSTSGLSEKTGGLLGMSIRPHKYHIEDNRTISIGQTKIAGAKRTWTGHTYCHILPEWEVNNFLGHSVHSYVVPKLFEVDSSNNQFVFDDSPK